MAKKDSMPTTNTANLSKGDQDIIQYKSRPKAEVKKDDKLIEETYHNFRAKYSKLFKGKGLEKLDKAFQLARDAHASQFRSSGAPYILHPIAVAEILIDLKFDQTSIITALLHDTLEDTDLSFEKLEDTLGKNIAKLVEGVTKLTRIEYQPVQVKQAENFRKLLLAISEDIRVLIVKLADRLHNMRTIHHIPSIEKRVRIAHETMEIYAPLSERIGIYKFKNELQDLAFSVLHPEIKKSIYSRLSFLRRKGGGLVRTIQKELKTLIEDNNLKCQVQGREKTCCSIWQKMEHKNVTFEQLADIMAFRVIVDKVTDCYAALGYIHTKYHTVPGAFKDYISTPKINGYKSLHTVVMGPEQRCIEIQIRTKKMHEVAELGVAAHWAYKQQQSASKTQGKEYRWIRELLNILENASSPEEFLENTKLEMYYDQVFCFTPKGELVALPKNATPVDFAFAVHSNVGLSCIGARVNGVIAPLKTILHNGDQVEIICSKTKMPSPAWEKFVVTGKAKAAIRKFIRSKQHEEYVSLGRALLNKTFSQFGQVFNEEYLRDLTKKFKVDTDDNLLAAIGEGVIDSSEILYSLFPELAPKEKKKNPFAFFRMKKKVGPAANRLPIKGLVADMAVHFSKCCNPLPGDKIVGIVGSGKGIAIHTVDCELLENFSSQPERWVDISWEGTGEELYIGRISATILNETGSLAEVTVLIAKNGANISDIQFVSKSIDFFEIILDLEVKGITHLSNIINGLRTIPCVHNVERSKNVFDRLEK